MPDDSTASSKHGTACGGGCGTRIARSLCTCTLPRSAQHQQQRNGDRTAAPRPAAKQSAAASAPSGTPARHSHGPSQADAGEPQRGAATAAVPSLWRRGGCGRRPLPPPALWADDQPASPAPADLRSAARPDQALAGRDAQQGHTLSRLPQRRLGWVGAWRPAARLLACRRNTRGNSPSC